MERQGDTHSISLTPGTPTPAVIEKEADSVARKSPLSASTITLPWPPATLSGHNKGHWHAKSGIVSKHREWARLATMEAKPAVPADGDIRVSVMFYPPDNRGDRVNYPNRMKPYWDGIADALKVNDRRFLPSFHFALPVKDSRVVVTIGRDA